jgi:hypothetical protein
MKITLLLAFPLLAGCGGYHAVNPGMTTAEAAKEMRAYQTTRIEPFDGGYSASYYNNDTCILFKDDKVVAKNQAEEQRSMVAVGGVGAGGVTVCHAVCVPPGVSRQPQCESSAVLVAPRR